MSQALFARRKKVSPDWLAHYHDEPLELVSGEGCRVWDSAGNCYLDCFGGILTTLTGHGTPEVVEAVKRQASRIFHTSTLYLSEPMVSLAERIAELSGIEDAKVFFTTSGTEANDYRSPPGKKKNARDSRCVLQVSDWNYGKRSPAAVRCRWLRCRKL